MANTYNDPNFNIDTDCSVDDLTTIKGSAPDLDDVIWIYNDATLSWTDEDDAVELQCKQICYGETSGGAADAGKRLGHRSFTKAGVEIVFKGDASDHTLSGECANPASADDSSKDITLYARGTLANPIVFRNDNNAYDAAHQWSHYHQYGSFDQDYVHDKYATAAYDLYCADSRTNAAEQVFDHLTVTDCQHIFYMMDNGYKDLPLKARFITCHMENVVCHIVRSYGNILKLAATFDLSGFYGVNSGGSSLNWYFAGGKLNGGPGKLYFGTWLISLSDIRPTEVVPADLAAADAGTGETLTVTWSNGASYAAGDLVYIYNNAGDGLLSVGDATEGSLAVPGLTDDQSYTVYAKATSDGSHFSAASDTDTATPTHSGFDFPEASNVTDDDTVDGVAGTLDLPALNKVAPSDTLRGVAGTLDLPALNKVAPSDTLEGVAGTLDLPAISAVDPLDTLEGAAGTLDIPELAAVLDTDTLRGVAGTFDAPAYAAAYEAGRNTLIDTADVKAGEDIHQLGAHRTGALDITAPGTPVIACSATGVTVDGDAGATNSVYFRQYGPAAAPWALLGSRAGDGEVAYGDLSDGKYMFMAVSADAAGNLSLPSAARPRYVGGDERSIHERVWLDAAADLEAEGSLSKWRLDRKENRIQDILRGGEAPDGSLPYLCAEWGRETGEAAVDEYDEARGRLTVYLLIKDRAGEKAGTWDLARYVAVVQQTLEGDRTRGGLVLEWFCRRVECSRDLVRPYRLAAVECEYTFNPELAARVSV